MAALWPTWLLFRGTDKDYIQAYKWKIRDGNYSFHILLDQTQCQKHLTRFKQKKHGTVDQFS